MANTGKTTTTRSTTTTKYKTDKMIPCRSVRFGSLKYDSLKSGNTYIWSDYGDICDVTYGDLLSLKSAKSKFIFEPWFIIEDAGLMAEWGLADMYSYFTGANDIAEFLQNDASSLKERLHNAPNGYKDLVVNTAGRMLRDGELDSIKALKIIDEELDTKLSVLLGGR